jgi:hypothetical protein
MKITICGSIAFYEEMLQVKTKLENFGHEVKLPPSQIKNQAGDVISVTEYYQIRKSGKLDNWIWVAKKEAMLNHFAKEEWSDAILVINQEKNGISGYVGANTLIEMGIAMFLKKKIYLLYDIPDMACNEEIRAMQPISLKGDLNLIN